VFAIGVVAVVALVAAVVRAADMQPRPAPAAATAAARREAPATAAPGSCAQCHADVSSHQVLHPKVAECASCHVQAPNAAHQFEEKQCLTCHQVATPKDTFVHGPVAAGDCLTCHTAHGAEEPQLLRAFGPELCESCHVEMKALRAEKRFTHSPVKEDCATCHNPHASPARYQLRDPSAKQCFACHKTMKDELATARVKHEAVKMERECLNCHDPHASNLDSQLRTNTMDLCLSCHDREQQAPSGTVQNIKGWLSAHTNLHGPIRQQDCVGCHSPHESKHFRLLRREYPDKFYSAFDPKNYQLCFMCHQPDLVTVEHTTTLTAFRNGNRNLHFVHVNQAEKGRTCRACHEAHSSSSPKHLREKVPFGVWQLPVRYQASDEGGSCAPGCHVARAYDRLIPATNDLTPTPPTTPER
jgi:predicted CXXCH cytochrome family protein